MEIDEAMTRLMTPKGREDPYPAYRALRGAGPLLELAEGFYVARRGFIALNLALNAADVDAYAAAVERFLDARAPLL